MDANDLLAAAYIYDEFFTEKDNALNWLDSKSTKHQVNNEPNKDGKYLALPIFGGWL